MISYFSYSYQRCLQVLALIFTLVLTSVYDQNVFSQTIVDLKSIGEEQGLSTRIVEYVIRDDRGLFYVFSNKSIQQFDGEHFTEVNSNIITDQRELLSDIISVEKKSENRFVITLRNSKNQYILNTEKNLVEFSPSTESRIFKDGVAYKLERTGDATQLKSIENIYGINISIPYNLLELYVTGDYFITQDEFYKVYVYKDNKLLAADYDGRIIKVDDKVYLWSNTGVYKFVNGAFVVIHTFDNTKELCGLLKKDKSGNMIAAYSDRTNYFHKLYILDAEEHLIDYHKIVEEYPTIKDIYSDDVFHKMMVVGYNGIKVYSFLREGANFYLKRANVKEGDFGRIIMGTAADHAGNVLVQSESGEILQYHNDTKEFDELFTKENKIVSEGLSSLKYDDLSDCFYSRGYSYAAHSDLYRYNLSRKEWTHRRINYKINDFEFLENQQMLIVGYNFKNGSGILAEYDFEQNKLVTIRDDLKRGESIYLDKENSTIWISTFAGIEVLDMDYKTLTKIDKYQPKDHYILYDHISMFLPYNDDLVACSRGGGVYILDPVTHQVLHNINAQSGLTEDMAVAATIDDAGRLWIGTFNGLNVLDSDYKFIKNIYAFEGLPNKEFNTRASTKNMNGELIFGTLNGLCVIDPEEALSWERTYKVHVDKIQIYHDDELVEVDEEVPITFYNSIDSLKLSYTIADYFLYPFVSTPVNVASKEKDFFRSMSYSGSKVLTDFKTGENEIYLRTDNERLDQIISVKVNPDNRNIYYFIFISALVLGLLYLIAKAIIDANKVKEQEKTSINKKISELQLASLQAQMNPHFIFNALGAIQYFIQTQDSDKADEYLSDFAKLMRKILESSKKKYVSIKEELKMLELYIGLEKLRFEDMFDYEIVVEEEIDVEMKIPPMIIQPIIENAINHGIYHLTDRQGKLTILLAEKAEACIMLTVTDNGVGRKKAQELRSKIHASRGMQIVKERIETINKTEEMKVELFTDDLVDNDLPKGTEVKIIIQELYL